METREEEGGVLVVQYDSTPWMRLLVAIGLVFIATAVYDLTLGARENERLLGLLAAAATCALCGIAMLETTRFAIDPRSRTVLWRRRWGFRVREGSFAFADIRSVGTQIPIGDEGVPSRRICFQLLNAPEVPVTLGYRPDPDDALVGLSLRIARLVGTPPYDVGA
jgi:hypothetical protein